MLHELGHLVALKALKVPVLHITLKANGTFIETGYLSPMCEWISALAGPLAGIMCLFFSKVWPNLAICGFLQSIYNLLPFPDNDGGRVINVLLQFFFSDTAAEQADKWIHWVTALSLVLIGVYLWLHFNLGVVSFLICMIPVVKWGIAKFPCKPPK